MKNKLQLLTTIGLIILVMGTSFLVGTIYRSTIESEHGLFSLAGATPVDPTLSMFPMPPRNCDIELTADGTIDVYLLNSKGIAQWLSEGTLNPVWFAKNTSSESTSIKLPDRGNYNFVAINPYDDSKVAVYGTLVIYGYESDLLLFSVTLLVIGLVLVIASKMVLQSREKRSIAVVIKKGDQELLPKKTMSNAFQSKIILDRSRSGGKLCRLLVWEFEQYLAFPMVEIIIVIAVLTVLTPTIIETLPGISYNNLLSGIQLIFLFLIFMAGVLFCHSYAGSLSRGETKLILSYPVQRSKLFLAKFIALFTVFSVVYVGVFALQLPLLVLNPFEPVFYVSVLLVLLHLFLVCTIATALSVVTKNEVLSILTSVLLLFGVESIASMGSLATFTGRFTMVFSFFRHQFHGGLSSVPLFDVLVSVFVVLGVSVLLFVFSYVYFTRKMEID